MQNVKKVLTQSKLLVENTQMRKKESSQQLMVVRARIVDREGLRRIICNPRTVS